MMKELKDKFPKEFPDNITGDEMCGLFGFTEIEFIKQLMSVFEINGVLIRDTKGKYFIVNYNFTETIIELTGASYDSFFGNDHIEFFEAEHEIEEYLVGKEIKIYTTLTDKEIVLSGEVVLGEVVYGSLIGIVQAYPEYKIGGVLNVC